MKRFSFITQGLMFLFFAGSIFLISCEDDSTDINDESEEGSDTTTREYYHVLGQLSGDTESSNYIASASDLTTGSLSFLGNGYEAQSAGTQGTLIFSSAHDDYLYAVDYHGGGKVDQYIVQSDGTYALGETYYYDVVLGTATARGTILDEETFAMYICNTEEEVDENGDVTRYKNIATIALLDLPDLTLRTTARDTFYLPESMYDEMPYPNCQRIEVPHLSGDKLYFGMTLKSAERSYKIYPSGVHTYVLDYPSLENGQVISTGLEVSATTNCDASNGMQADENGDIYQFTRYSDDYENFEETGGQAYFLRIIDGTYDNSYSFDIAQAVGENIVGMHWQYVGDGIGYAVVKDIDKENADETNLYNLVRVDLYNKTAVRLNTPYGNLMKVRGGIVEGDYYYYPITPDGGEAAVYQIDITSDSADAFTKGLEFDKGISMTVQGIL